METKRLEYFVALAGEGNYVRAANRLYMSQPSLSQHIRRLEMELGVELIDRRMRPWRLTSVGQLVLERSKSILAEVNELKNLIRSAKRGTVGGIRIGVVPGALAGRVPRLLREYVRKNPHVTVSINPVDTTTARTRLNESEIDVAIALEEFVSDGLYSRTLYEQGMLLVVSRDHRLASELTVNLRQLENEVLCLTPRATASSDHDKIIAACVDAGFSPREYLQVGNYTHQIGLVAAGVCIAIVPEESTGTNRDDVVFKSLTDLKISVSTNLIWRRDNSNPVCREFIESITG